MKDNIVNWHSKALETVSTKTVITSRNANDLVLNFNKNLHDDSSSDELNLCCIVRQIAIPICMQAAVLEVFKVLSL